MAALESHAGHDHSLMDASQSPSRGAAVRRAGWLNAATIGWNSVEGLIAVTQ